MESFVYKSLANLLASRAIATTHSGTQKYKGNKERIWVQFTGIYRKTIPNEVFEKAQELSDKWTSSKESEENIHAKEYWDYLNQVNEEYAKCPAVYNCHHDNIELKELFSIPELKEEIIEAFRYVGWDDDLGSYDTMNPEFDLEKNQIIFKIYKYGRL